MLLRVADTGEGIPAEHLPHVFERFYRADPARTRTTGGVGLGLAICGWVAQAHRGRLTVESELGRGTVFSLWLPAVQPPLGRTRDRERTGSAPPLSVSGSRAAPGTPGSRG